jgi:hypothetical protein
MTTITHRHDHNHQHGYTHSHSHGHHHHHRHGHQERRSLSTIKNIIWKAEIPAPAQEMVIRAFELLGEAEAAAAMC